MFRVLFLILVLCLPCWPQLTTVIVTGTVRDGSGNAYAGGSGRAVLVSGNNSGNQNWLVHTTNPVPNPVIIYSLDSSGAFSMSLTMTSAISPASAQPQWRFQFCASDGVTCFTMTPLSITVAQDISAQIQAQAASLPLSTSGCGPGNCVTKNPSLTQTITQPAGTHFGISGDVSVSGVITANLTGNVTGNVTGNLTGNVTGNTTGSHNGPVGNVTPDAGTFTIATIKNLNSIDIVFADQFAGADIGAKINAAYAALPASGGTIYISPKADGSCYDFSTPILFTTANKYPLLVALGASGLTGITPMKGCLNYTPTTATSAITLDYATPTGSPFSSAHGLTNITLVNNQCTTTGGCGSSAVGIDTGTTNQGSYEASFDNVSVVGFGTGFRDLNNGSVQIHWKHPKFHNNTVAILLKSITGFMVDGGQMAGNITVFKTSDAGSTPEIMLYATSFFNNPGSVVDATATTGVPNFVTLSTFGVHWEGTITVPFVTGQVNLKMFGGLMENTQGGAVATLLNLTGLYFASYGVEYKCTGTCASLLTAGANVRGVLGGIDQSNGHFTAYVDGTTTHITNNIFPGYAGVAVTPWTFESPISAPNFISTAAPGTQPYAGTSTTMNTNLNADMVDGFHAGNASTGKAMCWKDATHMGNCSTVVAADGTCTCN